MTDLDKIFLEGAITHFLQEPLSTNYFSSNNFSANKKHTRVDVSIQLFLDTDYGITKSGEVRQIGKKNNLADKLFALNDNGTRNEFFKPLAVTDKNILSGLTKPSELTQSNNRSGSKRKELPVYYSATNNRKDALNVFTFMSDNSPVEFSLSENLKKEWVGGTMKSETIGAMLEKVLGNEKLE